MFDYAEIILNVPGSEKLHFLVSAAITGYLQQLNGIIPDVLDNLGRRFLTFENFKFEIINSDLNQIDKHKVAINFFSRSLLWHDSIDQYLLVSAFNEKTTDEIFTNPLHIQPFVSIHAIKNIS